MKVLMWTLVTLGGVWKELAILLVLSYGSLDVMTSILTHINSLRCVVENTDSLMSLVSIGEWSSHGYLRMVMGVCQQQEFITSWSMMDALIWFEEVVVEGQSLWQENHSSINFAGLSKLGKLFVSLVLGYKLRKPIWKTLSVILWITFIPIQMLAIWLYISTVVAGYNAVKTGLVCIFGVFCLPYTLAKEAREYMETRTQRVVVPVHQENSNTDSEVMQRLLEQVERLQMQIAGIGERPESLQPGSSLLKDTNEKRVVKICNEDGVHMGFGFAMSIMGRTALFTAKHVVEGKGRLIVRGPNGDFKFSQWKHDVAASVDFTGMYLTSAMHSQLGVRKCKLEATPNHAGSVSVCSIRNGEIHRSVGVVLGLASKFRFKHSASTMSGSSGSPIFNQDKNVVGIHLSTNVRGENLGLSLDWLRDCREDSEDLWRKSHLRSLEEDPELEMEEEFEVYFDDEDVEERWRTRVSWNKAEWRSNQDYDLDSEAFNREMQRVRGLTYDDIMNEDFHLGGRQAGASTAISTGGNKGKGKMTILDESEPTPGPQAEENKRSTEPATGSGRKSPDSTTGSGPAKTLVPPFDLLGFTLEALEKGHVSLQSKMSKTAYRRFKPLISTLRRDARRYSEMDTEEFLKIVESEWKGKSSRTATRVTPGTASEGQTSK